MLLKSGRPNEKSEIMGNSKGYGLSKPTFLHESGVFTQFFLYPVSYMTVSKATH